jgi:hypothetical protein
VSTESGSPEEQSRNCRGGENLHVLEKIQWLHYWIFGYAEKLLSHQQQKQKRKAV